MPRFHGAFISLALLAVAPAEAQPSSTVMASPASVNLNYQIGGPNNQGAQQAVTLSTAAAIALPYAFGTPNTGANSQGCNWISVNPASGTIPAGGAAVSTISYSCASGFAPGTYSGSIPIAVTGGTLSTTSIPVNLVVSNSPLLFVPTDALNFNYEIGMMSPAAQSITPQSTAVAASSTTGQIPITASASAAGGGSWLVVSAPGALNTGSPISVSVNPAGLPPGTYTGTVTVTPAAGATLGNGAQTIPVTLIVGNGPSVQVSGDYGGYSGPIPPPAPVPLTSISFAYQTGQPAPPLQGVMIYSSTGDPLDYSVSWTEATCGSVTWLTLGGNASGVTAGLAGSNEFAASVQNLGDLPVGECTGAITVTATNPATGSPALGSPLSIPVTLYVSNNPLLSVYAPYLGFILPAGGSVAEYSIGISSTTPGATIPFALSVATSSGGNWLSASINGTGIASVSANPGQLPVGTYNGTVTITATGPSAANSPLTIPVTLKIVPGALVFSANSLAFSYTSGGTNPAAQTVTVYANAAANFTFKAAANSGTAGANWLSVSPSNGETFGALSVGVDPSGLAPGTYTGTVTVTSPNATNSPFAIPVTLTVYAGTISASPAPTAGLTFTLPQGGFAPPFATGPSQTITISKMPGSLTLGAATSTATGGNWLSFTTIVGSTSSTLQLQVSVSAGNLPVGTYSGAITITAAHASGSPITYPVTLIIEPDLIISTSPASLNFNYTLNAPAPAAQTVQASPEYTNGTEPIGPLIFTAGVAATTASGGNWLSVTQLTSGDVPGSVSVSVNPASLAAGSYSGAVLISSADLPTATIPVTLTVSAQATPVITAVANAASGVAGGVSPGEEVAIYGTNLGPPAAVTATPTSGVYATALSGVQVSFDGTPAPVIAAANKQVNVMVPYSVSGRANTAVEVSYLGITSTAFNASVVAAAPGVYTVNQTGSGQGAILNQDFSVNGPNHPASPGSVVAIYMTGEGVTSPASVTGQVAPTDATGLNAPVQKVSATLNQVPAQVVYAGSAPGLIYGVMQIDVQIPANAPAGNLFVVVTVGSAITQGGVTVAVQ